ncbi:hypothetical protein ABIE44_002299 [Marmoricola sp. OAE513]
MTSAARITVGFATGRSRLAPVEAFFVVLTAAVVLGVAAWAWRAIDAFLNLTALEPGDE